MFDKGGLDIVNFTKSMVVTPTIVLTKWNKLKTSFNEDTWKSMYRATMGVRFMRIIGVISHHQELTRRFLQYRGRVGINDL